MNQPTRSDSAIVPILVFFVIVGVTLFALFPRTSQRSTEEVTETAAPAAVAEEPTAVPTVATEATEAVEVTDAPTAEVTEVVEVTEAPTVVAEADATEVVDATEAVEFDPAAAYAFACAGCHGADASGVEGIGPSLRFSTPVVSRDTAALVALFNVAQPPADPAEGFVHAYRGGYPELSDDQLSELMEYLFTLASS